MDKADTMTLSMDAVIADAKKKISVILIVEDDPSLANLYDKFFIAEGYKTIVARDGEDGLNKAIVNKPDFILLDMNLPKLTGIQVFEKLLDDPIGKNIPVIFLTNNTDPAERDKAMKLGAKDYIAKAKYPPEEIVGRVKKYLDITS